MDRTAVKMTTFAEQEDAFCLSLSPAERLAVLEEMNRAARRALGYDDAPLDRTRVSVVWRQTPDAAPRP